MTYTAEATGSLSVGDLCDIDGVTTIKSGLPGAEVVATVGPVAATNASDVRLKTLGIVLGLADGSGGSIGAGDLVTVLRRGVYGTVAGSPSVGDPVYLSDTGIPSLTQGTYARRIGTVVSAGGGTYYYDFTGDRAPDVRNNPAGTADPGASNDESEGYEVGSWWINTSTGDAFVCLDASAGAAVWSSVRCV